MKKKTGTSQAPQEPSYKVVLKPLLGIPPRTYLAVLYSVVLVLGLFFLLLYPGLSNPGAVVTFSSLPEGASIHIDGKRLGATPCTVFVPAGKRTIVLTKPHFKKAETTQEIPSRLIGSLFSEKKLFLSLGMELESSQDLLESAHKDFASWALIGTPAATNPFPPVLSEAVKDYYLATKPETKNPGLVDGFLLSAAKTVNTEGIFRDYVSAAALAGSQGKALTPAGLGRTAALFARLYKASDYTVLWLAENLPEKAGSELLNSAPVLARLEALSSQMKKDLTAPLPAVSGAKVRIGTGDFVLVPEGSLVLGWAGTGQDKTVLSALAPPKKTQVKSFYLAASEVTEAEYAEFLKEVPAWALENRKDLLKQGSVDEGYLASWKSSQIPPNPSFPIREVSYAAARAYCDWLGGKYPAYVFTLPTEEQWEWAASLNARKGQPGRRDLGPAKEGGAGLLGLQHLEDNVWEWCSDWYFPAAYVFPAPSAYPGAEKNVRGGSWLNPEGSVTVSTRASQPASWCTPYLGFRVAAGRK